MENLKKYTTVIFFFFIVFLNGILYPMHNWDMIGYTASIYHSKGYRGQKLLLKTYDDVKKVVSKPGFENLTSGPYNEVVYSDPVSLEQQIPFYSIRPVYLGLVQFLNFFLDSYPKSTYVVSALFAGFSAIIVGLILIQLKIPLGWMILILPLSGLYTLGTISSPDSLATFFMLFIFYFAIKGYDTHSSFNFKNVFFIFLLFSLSILPFIRTDYILYDYPLLCQ